MNTDEDTPIVLEDRFFLSTHLSKPCRIVASSTFFSIYSLEKNALLERIAISSIYGCLCMKPMKASPKCHLVIFVYGKKSKKSKFIRSQRIFTYAHHERYEKNFSEVVRWHQHLTNAIYLHRNLPMEIVEGKHDKPVLLFVNPAGGAGKALRLVMEYVVGIWSEAQFPHHIIVTEYAGHARDFVRTMNLDEWSGIVVASGDGLVFEVINGLFQRQDWLKALKLPIGHLPCGSGNAFITSIIHNSKQPLADSMEKFVVQAAILLATHQVLPFDMAVVDTVDSRRFLSFLSIEWAVIADVDCESEKYRFLGGTRFTVEAVKRVLQPRTYSGHIDYLPYENEETNEIQDGTSINEIHRHLSPLDKPLVNEHLWRRIEGPFSYVLITSKSALSKDTLITPDSTLTDGFLTLQFIRTADANRFNLLKMFLSLEDGSHLQYDFVKLIRIRAFRIVPTESDGNLMVDGEKVQYGPIQGEILPRLGRCMGKY